ncbi:MAG: flagellar biosynthesis protein FliQ [Acidobacteria bacterium]|nr:flagellar biosynthesis protein FliQ [Acidobacteriota bacterium]MBI3471946.1 flagellar biosynthesis protein FliQ [Candidatus Solibacter usitatus]
MTAEAIMRILREALLLVLILSGGPMLASMLIGFLVSIFQATTQIQEQTLSYVPKLVACFLTIAILGPWMLVQMVRFTRALFDGIMLVR